jgi:hypothetical protein
MSAPACSRNEETAAAMPGRATADSSSRAFARWIGQEVGASAWGTVSTEFTLVIYQIPLTTRVVSYLRMEPDISSRETHDYVDRS